jgi:hypothetical protein
METIDVGEDHLGALLSASAPPAPGIPADRLAGLSAALAHEVVGGERSLQGRVRGLRRRHRVAAGVATAAIVFVPTGAWAAQHLLAQTGRFGNPAVNPDEDRSELINTCAADFAAHVNTLAPPDLPAPPGHSWHEYATAVAKGYTSDVACSHTTEGTVQDTGLRLDLLARASADWGCALVWADEDGNRAAMHRARKQMLDVDSAARRLSTVEGAVGTQDPDVFLANSRLQQWVGCQP